MRGFDKLKQFEVYFPEFNFEKVITKYNAGRRKNPGYRFIIQRKKSQVKKKLAIVKQLLI